MSLMPDDSPALSRQIEKLKKINASLMSRLEREHKGEPNAFALFENAATVERQVRQQTEDLRQAMRVLERSNEALHQAKQIAEAANALKTSFLASVSHDLLQPLHAARLALAVLSDTSAPPAGNTLLSQADRSLGTLEEIIKTLLDLSKLDAGVLKPEIRGIGAVGLIEDLCAEFGAIAAHRGLILRRRGSASNVLTDPLMLRRILQNLLSNAIRYTRRGGVLVCCTEQIGFLRIDIADTGPGIQADRHAAIFEEFQREDPGVGDEPGCGLGLAIVRRLAIALGHEIKLWSRPGLGSVFSILVPCCHSQDLISSEAGKVPPAAFDGLQVLLIAKRAFSMGDAAHLLQAWGCEIAHASSREEASLYLQGAERAPDLLITACDQGEVQAGAELIAALRTEAESAIPAFLIGTMGEAVPCGLEVMPLPVKAAELRALIAHLMGPAA